MAKYQFGFVTGRVYGPNISQYIVGMVEYYSADEYGFRDCRVIFWDNARSIGGAFVMVVDYSAPLTPADIQKHHDAILARYDSGKYESLSYDEYLNAVE